MVFFEAPSRLADTLAAGDGLCDSAAVKVLVEDGVRGVPGTVIEAATSAGSSRLQMILKVQLPMASRSLLVATNQGVILVLAMVVVGGLVGRLRGGIGFVLAATGWWFILAQWAPIYGSILKIEFLQPLAALAGWAGGVDFFNSANGGFVAGAG